jgi:HPt (histidine-containing phosphotransfer) domain-containing protein
MRRIRAAIDARDGEALQRAAHALKGAAANFDAPAVTVAARQLEEMGRQGQFGAHEPVWQSLNAETASLVAALQAFTLPAAGGLTA